MLDISFGRQNRLPQFLGGPGGPGKALSGWDGYQPAIFQAAQGETVSASDPRLFEDVLEMNLDGSRPDAQFHSDLFILEALFHQLQDLLFA